MPVARGSALSQAAVAAYALRFGQKIEKAQVHGHHEHLGDLETPGHGHDLIETAFRVQSHGLLPLLGVYYCDKGRGQPALPGHYLFPEPSAFSSGWSKRLIQRIHRLPVVSQDQDQDQTKSQDNQGAVIVALVNLGPLEGQQQGAGKPPHGADQQK